jgi:hypothetical protein
MSSDNSTNPSTPARLKNRSYPDHSELTPPNAAEHFFLPSLKSSDISALALSAAVRNNYSKHSSSQSVRSSAAAESVYVSCQGDLSEGSQQLNSDEEDALLTSSNRDTAEEPTCDELMPQDSNLSGRFKFSLFPMQRKKKQPKKKTKGVKGDPSLNFSTLTATPSEVTFETPLDETPIVSPTSTAGSEGLEGDDEPLVDTMDDDFKKEVLDESNVQQSVSMDDDSEEAVVAIDALSTPPHEQHFDVGSHLYEHVKGMWIFGKTHIPVIKFFLAAAESVAETVLGNGKLQDVDTNVIQPILSDFDRVYLDPVITKLLEVISPFVHKMETAVVKVPLIPQIIRHIGITVIDHQEEPINNCEDNDDMAT